jgi:heme oxygenase (mycobilin-producing)
MFVALSKFVIANDTSAAVKNAFCQRPHLVESAAGFVRLDVLSPEKDPNEIWLITYWATRDNFEEWHRSHLYRESHSGIPKGLKLVPKTTSLTFFEHVAS